MIVEEKFSLAIVVAKMLKTYDEAVIRLEIELDVIVIPSFGLG